MNTNPAPERTWSLSSKEVKALSHASGSDYVYALTEDEVSVSCTLLLQPLLLPLPLTHPTTQHATTPQTADSFVHTHAQNMSAGMHTEYCTSTNNCAWNGKHV